MFFYGLMWSVIVKFLQKDIEKFKENVGQTKVKKDSFKGKKRKHGTEGNELKWQFLWLNPLQRLIMVKAVGYFWMGAPSLVFGGILNATLSEKASTTGVHKTILNSPCLLILLIHTKHKQ